MASIDLAQYTGGSVIFVSAASPVYSSSAPRTSRSSNRSQVAPESPRNLVVEISLAERNEPYAKSLKTCERLLGVVNTFSVDKKNLRDKPLAQALKVCDDALAYGYDDRSSLLGKLNFRLMLYFRKALIEYNLDLKDRPIITINKALGEISKFGSVNETNTDSQQRSIFGNYKDALLRQKEAYSAELSTSSAVAEAKGLMRQGSDAQAVELLEKAFFDTIGFNDPELALVENIPVLNLLLEHSLEFNAYADARSYAEYMVELIVRTPKTGELATTVSEEMLVRLANNMRAAYSTQSSDALKAIDSLCKKFPASVGLASFIQELKKEETEPFMQLTRIYDLMQSGNIDDAYLEATEQALKFENRLAEDAAALKLWIIKMEGELATSSPDDLIASLEKLKTVTGNEKVIELFEGYGISALSELKKAFLAYVFKTPDESLGLVRSLLADRKVKKEDFAQVRELAYWLELKSLTTIGTPAGSNLKAQIKEEYPDSRLFTGLI